MLSMSKVFSFRNKNRNITVHVEASKKTIPKALRNAVWETYNGKVYEIKCPIEWCKTLINPFTFEVGHNIPESKGGPTTIDNLRPICSQCNKSMGNSYTIIQFNDLYKEKTEKTEKTEKQKTVKRKKFASYFCLNCYNPST